MQTATYAIIGALCGFFLLVVIYVMVSFLCPMLWEMGFPYGS